MTTNKSAKKTTPKSTKKAPAKKAAAKKSNKNKEQELIADNTKLKLILPWKEVEEKYNHILKKSAKKVKAQGFRAGKVPVKIAEEKIGRERLVNEALEQIIPAKYEALIAKEKKAPLTQPEIKPVSMKWGEDWELEIHIAERPKIKVDGYKKAVKAGIKDALKHIKEEEKAKNTTDKEAKKKNTPDKPKAPKITPEEKARQEKEHKLSHIFRELVAKIQPQVPELLLKEETKREIQKTEKELQKMGLSLDDYLKRRGQSFEEMSSQIAAQVLGQLQLEFILREIEVQEKVEASDREVKAEIEKIEDKNMRAQIEKNPPYLEYFTKQIVRQKLIDQLLSTK